MSGRITQLALLVRDYDEAIAFFTRALGFELLEDTLRDLRKHDVISLLHGKPAWAFIHGDWALANSRRDGKKCGVDDELRLLQDAAEGFQREIHRVIGAPQPEPRRRNAVEPPERGGAGAGSIWSVAGRSRRLTH